MVETHRCKLSTAQVMLTRRAVSRRGGRRLWTAELSGRGSRRLWSADRLGRGSCLRCGPRQWLLHKRMPSALQGSLHNSLPVRVDISPQATCPVVATLTSKQLYASEDMHWQCC